MDEVKSTNEQVPVEPVKAKSKTWLIVAIVIVVALIVILLILWSNNRNSNSSDMTTSATVTSEESAISNTEPAAPSLTSATIDTATSTTRSTTEVFSLTNLRKAYVTIGTSNYKLTNGSYTNSSAGYDQPSSITLDETSITNDTTNSQQIAVILKVQYSGSGVSKVLEIMGNKGGQPQHVANTTLNEGQSANIQSITFASSLISINMLVVGENDSQASPSVSKDVSYTLTSNSQLIQN